MAGKWQVAMLGEVADFLTGFPFKSDRYTDDTLAPRLLRGDNIAQGTLRWDGVKRWPEKEAENLVSYLLMEDDVVLAMDRPWIEAGLKYAAVRESDLPAFLVQRVARLRGTNRLDSKFLKYVIGCPAFTRHVLAIQTGTAVPHISGNQIKAFEFLLPPLTEQHAIAHILGTLDDKIELNRRMNETLEAMARAMFKAWFVDFEPVRAKMDGRWQRGQSLPGLPAHLYDLFPRKLVESELGVIPEGWEINKLGDATKYLSRGISPKYLDNGGILVLNQKCIRNFRIDTSKGRRHDSSQKSIDGRTLELGDILVNSTGVGTLGRVAQVIHLDEETIVDSHVTVIRAINRAMSSYLGQCISLKQPDIETMGEGSTGQTELSRSKLTQLPILVPSEEALTAFDAFVSPANAQISKKEGESRSLAQLRGTLLPKLISGELRVPDAERIVGAIV